MESSSITFNPTERSRLYMRSDILKYELFSLFIHNNNNNDKNYLRLFYTITIYYYYSLLFHALWQIRMRAALLPLMHLLMLLQLTSHNAIFSISIFLLAIFI